MHNFAAWQGYDFPVRQYRYATIHSAPSGSGEGNGSSKSEIRCLVLPFLHTAMSWSSSVISMPSHGHGRVKNLRLERQSKVVLHHRIEGRRFFRLAVGIHQGVLDQFVEP